MKTVVSLSWSEPGDNGGSPITGYRRFSVRTLEIHREYTTIRSDTGSATTSYTDGEDLTTAGNYHYVVQALNAQGSGPSSNIFTISVQITPAPGVPTKG